MKEFDLLVRSWEPDSSVDGSVILVGKGARHDVMIGMFNDIVLAVIPTIAMAIPSYISEVVPDSIIHTCPYIIRADVVRDPDDRAIRFRNMVGHAVASEDWFDFSAMNLISHATEGSLFACTTYAVYKGMVAANRMQTIYRESNVTPYGDDQLVGKKWVVGVNGLPMVLEEEGCDGSTGSDPDIVSCDDSE